MALATATAMATPAMGFVLTEQSNKLQMDPLARTYQKGHIQQGKKEVATESRLAEWRKLNVCVCMCVSLCVCRA